MASSIAIHNSKFNRRVEVSSGAHQRWAPGFICSIKVNTVAGPAPTRGLRSQAWRRFKPQLEPIRVVVKTSLLDEDPPCVGVEGWGGSEGYARYHLSDEHNGQNLLA